MLEQTSTQLNNNNSEDELELEESIDTLLDEFALHVNSIPTLSDYAVSREGIYSVDYECSRESTIAIINHYQK